jgi:hypothetical protein
MRLIVLAVVAFLVVICSPIVDSSVTSRGRRALNDAVPLLRKPIIIDSSFRNPDAEDAAAKVAEILAKEPEAAAPPSDDDGEGDNEEGGEEGGIGESGEQAEGGAEGEAPAGGAEEGGGDAETDEGNSEVEEEIAMLEKLIGEGKKNSASAP